MAELPGIRGYDFVEFYVGSAKATAFWYAQALGLRVAGFLGPETGVRDRASYLLARKDLKVVVTSPLLPQAAEAAEFVERHGDGVKRWSIAVDDVQEAFDFAVRRGAVAAWTPRRLEDASGAVVEAALRVYDDTEIVLVDRSGYRGLFRPGFRELERAPQYRGGDTHLVGVDHIVGNVRANEMDLWADYFNRALGFETTIDFRAGDIGTRYSALLSKVVRSRSSAVKNPINEPCEGLKKSQIEEFLEAYRGSGVQHIAVATDDLPAAVRALRSNGVEFLSVPAAYYEGLRRRWSPAFRERVEDLRELGILCDLEGQGYLLQLFTRPVSDRPTFFYEFIQRREGAQGFGKGNFQALFEALELEQARRGNLEREPNGGEAGPPALER
jgi:4-hydroxyphenylpyruvate dioxygenase